MKTKTKEPASTNQSVATANDWPQHAASCHILLNLAAITIKVGALLQDEGPWFFTLFSREEPPFLRKQFFYDVGVVQTTHQPVTKTVVQVRSEVTMTGKSTKLCDVRRNGLPWQLVSLMKAVPLGNNEGFG